MTKFEEPFAFWSYSEEFLIAASKVKKPDKKKRNKDDFALLMPAYYLVGHSIELSLKSYLSAKGYSVNKLRYKPYGHNLVSLVKESRKRKLGREAKLNKYQIQAIELFNTVYQKKDLEYLTYGNYRLPEYWYIYEIAELLLKGLARYASNSPFFKIKRKRIKD
jgi:hypothetical protein